MGLLEADDVRFAAVELEALALAHPWPDDEAAFDHLSYIAESFRRHGYPSLLVSATVASDEYLRRLLDALPSEEVTLVRVLNTEEADPKSLATAIRDALHGR